MKTVDFKSIAVIGAGTMGSGIAAQIANAGTLPLELNSPGLGLHDAACRRA